MTAGIGTAEVDLLAERGTPFIDTTLFEGFDYSAAAFTMELRRYPDASGAPFVSLTNAASNAQGVSVTVTTEDGWPNSEVQIRINEVTIESLPFSSPRGGDTILYYALDIAGGGHAKVRRMKGAFIVKASANG